MKKTETIVEETKDEQIMPSVIEKIDVEEVEPLETVETPKEDMPVHDVVKEELGLDGHPNTCVCLECRSYVPQ